MRTLSRRKGLLAALSWLPVAGIIVALFVAPTSTSAASTASLNVTPGSGTYGGQALTFSGSVGPGNQRIWLQWRGNSGVPFVDIPDSGRWTTGPGGGFRFTFHAPTMDTIQVRVVSRTAVTPAHTLQTEHQEADLHVHEELPARVVWPDGPVLEPLPRGFAVAGEPYELRVDTVNRPSGDKRPVLPGRVVTLQRRQVDNSWQNVLGGQLDPTGLVGFVGATIPRDGVYRARLADWKANGDDIGWFPSLPFYLEIVDRPLPVILPKAAPTSSSVTLTWTLPPDPNRDRIVVVRGAGGEYPPTWAMPRRFAITTIGGTEKGLVDTSGIEANRTYRYALYTVSQDGVHSRLAARLDVRTPDARGVQ